MGSPGKIWNINGIVVPPGTLKPNVNYPYYHQTPEQRWEGIVKACANIVFGVT